MTSIIDGTRFARAAATRQAILDAAATLFVRDGFRFVSLRDIAAEAGISHPALLKHFAGKDELLAHVVDRFDRSAPTQRSAAFFAALTGEASAPAHPLHEVMRQRIERLRTEAQESFEAAVRVGEADAGRDAHDEAVRATAAALGLQLLAQYIPGRVDAARELEQHRALVAHPLAWGRPGAERHDVPAPAFPALAPDEPNAEAGYATGRARRAKIVEDATALFATEGYGDTSLLDIAQRVGVSKSALYHHFPSKDALLHAVLRERDRRIDTTVTAAPAAPGTEMLRGMPAAAAANEAEQPGLIELYAVISSEATPRGHAAHAYFRNRFDRAIAGFTGMFQAAAAGGDLPAHRDPAHEAIWLLALWDGLQYQWLYDRESVDIATQLERHLADVLPV